MINHYSQQAVTRADGARLSPQRNHFTIRSDSVNLRRFAKPLDDNPVANGQNETLQSASLFQDLSENDLEKLARHAIQRTYKRNAIVISRGDEGNSLYLILAGKVRVYLDDDKGNQVTIAEYGPGECFGELALFSGAERVANVVTTEDSRCAVLSQQAFMDFMREYPEVSFRVIGSLVERIQAMTEEINILALFDVYGRIRHTLMKLSSEHDGKRVTEKITHQDIANRIGSSREMVSRILRDLKDGGYISIAGKQITIERDLPTGW